VQTNVDQPGWNFGLRNFFTESKKLNNKKYKKWGVKNEKQIQSMTSFSQSVNGLC